MPPKKARQSDARENDIARDDDEEEPIESVADLEFVHPPHTGTGRQGGQIFTFQSLQDVITAWREG